MNILCLGDIVGKPGRQAVEELLPALKEEHSIDLVLANAENAAGGSGLTSRIAKQLFNMGCDVISLGDHVWDQKELEEYLKDSDKVIRPANFPDDVPGKGWCIVKTASGQKVGIINVLGRVFMRYSLNCPFRTVEALVTEIKKETNIIVVDLHAEATSEKVAMGHFVNGSVSAVVGTHTHIQTADETILSKGTAYITDLGMVGPYDSVIGQDKERIIERFIKCMPIKFQVAENDVKLCGVVINIDESTGLAKNIVRIQRDLKKG
ncbi:MAG: TIGR00282 family metallophosphoesterase [Candidatus Omnitrophica bacterium]|nr:TIGR00282 family metallophosphoesterase [Candidatus Omnitrophota bacterium]